MRMEPRRDATGALTRAQVLRGVGTVVATAVMGDVTMVQGAGAQGVGAQAAGERMQTRPIPSSKARLPVVGCGTWQTFDIGADPAERAQRAEVLRVLFAAGGAVIDSSPMYGRSEGVVGDLLQQSGERARAFVATKVWTRGRTDGIAQMQRSMSLLRVDKVDLMQVHNLVDWRTHLQTLRGWKQEGRIGYLGVTHYTSSAYGELEAVLRAETLDFVQLNYSADDRAAEQRLLPLAADRGIAVLINLPFGGGGLMRSLQGRPLPAFAAEIGCTSWAQLLLKFVLGHPAVTCVIPGTSKPDHMRDNVGAGMGPMPDEATRGKIAAAVRR